MHKFLMCQWNSAPVSKIRKNAHRKNAPAKLCRGTPGFKEPFLFAYAFDQDTFPRAGIRVSSFLFRLCPVRWLSAGERSAPVTRQGASPKQRVTYHFSIHVCLTGSYFFQKVIALKQLLKKPAPSHFRDHPVIQALRHCIPFVDAPA